MNALLGNLDGEYMLSANSEKGQESKAPGQIQYNQQGVENNQDQDSMLTNMKGNPLTIS